MIIQKHSLHIQMSEGVIVESIKHSFKRKKIISLQIYSLLI